MKQYASAEQSAARVERGTGSAPDAGRAATAGPGQGKTAAPCSSGSTHHSSQARKETAAQLQTSEQ